MAKKIIVTGGSGFLGKQLCRSLMSEGHQVRNIDLRESSEMPTEIADIRDAESMMRLIRDADAVFHLAALIESGESVKFPQKFIDSNISGTLNVLDAMRENQVPLFLFSSSAAIYGEPLSVPINEDDRTLPINPYGMTKLAMEALVSSYVSSYHMTGVALRYFNLYGPEEHHEPESHAIPRFIKQIYDEEEVTVWGSGEFQRDFIHVSDVVSAHSLALSYAESHPQQYHYYNISTENPTKVIDVIKMIEKEIGKPAKVKHFPDRPGDPLVLVANSTKAKEQLKWSPKISIEQGVAETVKYFSSIWQKS
ncbi:MAG: NAD-dependent epimerase/dehydratase family protein [Patescibacteria group bacterium]